MFSNSTSAARHDAVRREAVGTFTQQEVLMSKPRDVKKNVKKQPQKTLKEKRLEKKAKKAYL